MDHPFKIPSKKSRPLYRVIQEESAILWEMIVWVILSKKVHMNMGPILNGYRDNGKKKIQTIHSISPVKNRVIQKESAILSEMIVFVILSKKVHMNMGPILNGWSVFLFTISR